MLAPCQRNFNTLWCMTRYFNYFGEAMCEKTNDVLAAELLSNVENISVQSIWVKIYSFLALRDIRKGLRVCKAFAKELPRLVTSIDVKCVLACTAWSHVARAPDRAPDRGYATRAQ